MQPPKYPSTGHWQWSPTVHRDDSYHPDPQHFVNRSLIITEKVDGGNTCLHGGDAYARSVDLPSSHGSFAMVKKHHAWKSNYWDRDIFVYGEDIYGIHSLEYDAVLEKTTFRIFAIRKGDHFLAWEDVVAFSAAEDMLTVPVVHSGIFTSVEEIRLFLDDSMKVPSAYGGEREGFVMRVAKGFDAKDFGINVCKYVRANHVQTDEHWRRNWKPCKIKHG